MTLIGLEYLRHQETARHNKEAEAIDRHRIASNESIAALDRSSRESIASLDRASRESIASADRASRETIADADRTSREQIASLDRASRETISSQDRLSRENIAAADRYVDWVNAGSRALTSITGLLDKAGLFPIWQTVKDDKGGDKGSQGPGPGSPSPIPDPGTSSSTQGIESYVDGVNPDPTPGTSTTTTGTNYYSAAAIKRQLAAGLPSVPQQVTNVVGGITAAGLLLTGGVGGKVKAKTKDEQIILGGYYG